MGDFNRNEKQYPNNNNNQPRKQIGLLDKNVDIDPVGVVYNVTSSAIEEFVEDYLVRTRGINGVEKVGVRIISAGSRPEVALFLFVNTDSKDVYNTCGKIPQRLKNKMDSGDYRVTDEFKKALYTLTSDINIQVHNGGLITIRCNIFKALGLMFAADWRAHNLIIPEVRELKKREAIITVIKQNKFVDRDDSGGYDKYTDIMDKMDRDR